MIKGKYASKEDLLAMEVGEFYKYSSDDDDDTDWGDLCEIHRVVTGWIYVFSDSEIFVPDILNVEMHSNHFPLKS